MNLNGVNKRPRRLANQFAPLVAMLACGLAIPSQAGPIELAGSYIIQKPHTVTTVYANPTILDSWANANSHTAITPTQAFSSSPGTLNFGYINVGDMILDFTFDPILNGPGDEIALYDARFGSNSYDLSTDYDGFATPHTVPGGSFTDTGIDNIYHWGLAIPSATYLANIFEVAIDLSDLGVPEGATVTTIRMTSTPQLVDDIDPIAIGRIVPEPGSLALLWLGGLTLLRRRR